MAKHSHDFGELHGEARFQALVDLIGDTEKAYYRLNKFWSTALRYWGEGRRGIPAQVFALDPFWSHLLTVGFADVADDGSVLARGHEKHFEWLADRRDAASAGGKASAAARIKKFGNADPRSEIVNQTGTKREAHGNQTGTSHEPNVKPSISVSTSSSVSIKKKKLSTSGSRKTVTPSPEDEAVAREWFEMARRYSTTVSYGPSWPDTVRMLREIDKVDHATLRRLLAFVEADSFWRPNALSIVQLRARSKQNGLLKWENALATMKDQQGEHGGSSEAYWDEFERRVREQEAKDAAAKAEGLRDAQ